MAALLRHLRAEDVLLALGTLFGVPLVRAITGGAADDGPSVITGLIGLLAIAGVVACLLTRGPDERSPLGDGELTLQGWARFPLGAGVGIVAVETLPGIGISGDAVVGAVFVVLFATVLVFARLPVVPVAGRRLLVLPMTFVAAGAFDAITGDTLHDFIGGLVEGTVPGEIAAFTPLIVAAIATAYVMLVVAPRSIADPGASGRAWTVRFLLLLASVALGAAVFPGTA